MVKTQKRRNQAGGAYSCKDQGSGSFGIVSVCNDPHHPPVAVKFINANASNTQKVNSAVRQLENEIALLSWLKHENIVAMVPPVELPGDKNLVNPKLFLEYCDGGSLEEYMKSLRQTPGALVNIYDIAKQIFTGLEYLYTSHVVHMDFKPANVLVKQGVMKIADFGMAIDADKYNNIVCGTAIYMPPIKQCELGGYFRDIYAFVCIIYYCIFNEHYNKSVKGRTFKSAMKKTMKNVFPITQMMFNNSPEYDYFTALATIVVKFAKEYKTATTHTTEANNNRPVKRIQIDESTVTYHWLYRNITEFFETYDGMNVSLPISGEIKKIERRRSLADLIGNTAIASTQRLNTQSVFSPSPTKKSGSPKKTPRRHSIQSPLRNQLPQLQRVRNRMGPPPVLQLPST